MITEGFIAAGARVYISSRNERNCLNAASELGVRRTALPQDLSTVAGCEALAAEFSTREPKLDVLVNNAGIAWGEEFVHFSETGWDRVLDLNAKAPFS
jgi:NAD(P)-dependent dehydrogenase (short-subunit alcohol dehydrogenase family)